MDKPRLAVLIPAKKEFYDEIDPNQIEKHNLEADQKTAAGYLIVDITT